MATTLATPIPSALEHEPGRLTTRLLLVYIFMLYSRIFEAAVTHGVPNFYPMLLLSALSLMIVLAKGRFAVAARTSVGVMLLLFTMWAICAVPFSHWKSESLSQLVNVWFKSLAAFFIIVGLTTDFSDVRKAFSAFGWAAAVSTVVMELSDRIIGDRMTSIGSLGNSNEAAFHIMFGLPFMILLIMRVKPILKIPLVILALVSLALSIKTASRAGLLMAIVLTLVALLKVSPANKAKILAVAALALAVGLFSIDRVALDRYKTMLNDSNDDSEQAQSARESAESRKYLLKEGIEITLQHPVFGVGMGVFPVAAAELSESRGEHPLWLVSHNSYVQVSSETGFGGFFLIIGIFVSCFALILKLDRAAKRLELKELRSMTLCLLLSFVALAIHYFFDAAAYDLYMPMAAGLCTALAISAGPLIKEAEAKAGLPEGTAEPLPVEAGAAVGLAAGPSNGLWSEKSSKPNQQRNPYRLGRRRVSGR